MVLTHKDDKQNVKRAYQLGVNSYLVKPPTSEKKIMISLARVANHGDCAP